MSSMVFGRSGFAVADCAGGGCGGATAAGLSVAGVVAEPAAAPGPVLCGPSIWSHGLGLAGGCESGFDGAVGGSVAPFVSEGVTTISGSGAGSVSLGGVGFAGGWRSSATFCF